MAFPPLPPAGFFLLSLLKCTREDPHHHPAECSNEAISDFTAILTTTMSKQGTESSTAMQRNWFALSRTASPC
jgi:hypothetical protein